MGCDGGAKRRYKLNNVLSKKILMPIADVKSTMSQQDKF